MNPETLTPIIEKHGPLAACLVAVCILLFFILKWVFKNQDRILTNSEKQNVRWSIIQEEQNEKWRQVLTAFAESSKQFYEKVKGEHSSQKEASVYQRQEHKELANQLGSVTLSLTAITIELKSLNGKKNE